MMEQGIKLIGDPETAEVLRILAEAYPDAGCELEFGDPFQLLIAVVLSAQTTDKRVNEVTKALFGRYRGPEEIAEADDGELQEILRPIGMYRTKASNIRKLSRMIIEKHGGRVPDSQELLEELPGVGRKSANVVMAEAFGCQRIAVDTHVFRVTNRIGIVNEKTVIKTEEALMERIPEENWTAAHHQLIWHGRRVCSARKPSCDECALKGICAENGLRKK